VALETGHACSPEMALRFFRLLSATGYLALRETGDE
jgi:hypothetical protein